MKRCYYYSAPNTTQGRIGSFYRRKKNIDGAERGNDEKEVGHQERMNEARVGEQDSKVENVEGNSWRERVRERERTIERQKIDFATFFKKS